MVKNITSISISSLLGLFENQTQEKSYLQEDVFWGHVNTVLRRINEFFSKSHFHISPNERKIISDILNPSIIPDRYYQGVKSALREIVFNTLELPNIFYPLLARQYISFLSKDEIQALFFEVNDMLLRSVLDQQRAIFLFSALSRLIEPAQRKTLFDCLIKILATKNHEFFECINEPLIKLYSLNPVDEAIFTRLLSFLASDEEKNVYAPIRILKEVTLSSQQLLMLANTKKFIGTNKLGLIQSLAFSTESCGMLLQLLINKQTELSREREHSFLGFFSTLYSLALRASSLIPMNLEQASTFLEFFYKESFRDTIESFDMQIFPKIISCFPLDVQIGLRTHADHLPSYFSSLINENIQVRLEVEDSHREQLPKEMWGEVFRRV